MSVAQQQQELRWELVRCTACGFESMPREAGRWRGALPCAMCGQAREVVPLMPATRVLEATAVLQELVEQESRRAADDLDVVRRARRQGRADAFVEALELVADLIAPAGSVRDPLRKATSA